MSNLSENQGIQNRSVKHRERIQDKIVTSLTMSIQAPSPTDIIWIFNVIYSQRSLGLGLLRDHSLVLSFLHVTANVEVLSVLYEGTQITLNNTQNTTHPIKIASAELEPQTYLQWQWWDYLCSTEKLR